MAAAWATGLQGPGLQGYRALARTRPRAPELTMQTLHERLRNRQPGLQSLPAPRALGNVVSRP